jgi:GNAT superfamily N-acetyltransferase
VSEELGEADVAALFVASWAEGTGFSFAAARQHGLCWVSAHVGERLVGFVNVAWDGGLHAFLLDVTVHPEFRRKGIGTALVRCATEEARALGARVLHVDYKAVHAGFYRRCGFRATLAGLQQLGLAEEAREPERWRVRRFDAGDTARCQEILEGLSEWFVTRAAVDAYVADLGRVLTWVAVGADDGVVGFSSLTRPQPKAFEVHVLAVARGRQGQGVGRVLLELGERFALARGARFMQVKTAGPSRPDPAYEKTRGFYQRLGYEGLFESDRLWGDDNPVLVLVKALG